MIKAIRAATGYSLDLVISYMNLRIAIGLIGFAFPIILIIGDFLLTGSGIRTSISFYHHTVMRDVFTGMLFVIAALLSSYKGYDSIDNIISHLGCAFAIGIAIFPCVSNPNQAALSTAASTLHILHFISAVLFFLTLVYFCLFLFIKTDVEKPDPNRKRARNRIYKISGYTMLSCIFILAIYFLFLDKKLAGLEKINPVFWLETIMLWAFGLSWLTKGQAILKDHKV